MRKGRVPMFIVTARIPKKRLMAGAITVLCCAVAVITALVLTVGGRAVTASAEVSNIRNNDDRITFLAQQGWLVSEEAPHTEELLVPNAFDESYSDYLALQAEQGFDLTRYCGKRIKRYVYQVTNYPEGQDNILAVLLIYKNRIIGGQIQSADGIILHGLLAPSAPPHAAPAPSQLL